MQPLCAKYVWDPSEKDGAGRSRCVLWSSDAEFASPAYTTVVGAESGYGKFSLLPEPCSPGPACWPP